MSVILNPGGGGTSGGGGNVVDTLESTLNAGNLTGTASGVLFNDGDVLAMASGAKLTFSSNSNPGGLPDIIVGRSGTRDLTIYSPNGNNVVINLGDAGAIAFDRGNTGVRLDRGGSQELAVRRGDDGAYGSVSTAFYDAYNGSTLKIRVNGSSNLIQLASDTDIRFSSTTNPTVISDICISRSGEGLVAFWNPKLLSPATGHLNAAVLGPLSASGSKLANDNNGRILVQDAVGVPGNISLNGINFGAPTTVGALMSLSTSDIVIRRGDGGQGNSGSSLRIAKYGSATNCALQLNNEIFDGLFGLSSVNVSTSVSGVEQLRVANTGISIGPRLLIGATVGNVDAEIARSGVGSLAIRNPITNGPASLTVGDLTVLGTHNIVAAGGGSAIFATGLVVGTHSASGSKLVSDSNGRLIVQNGDSAIAPIFASEIKFGHPTIAAQQYLLKNSSLANGGAMLVDITSTSQQYLTVLGIYGGNQEEFFLGTNGLDIQGNADIRWNSNLNDILSNFDLQVSRSGVGLIAINNPSTEAPATGHLNAVILGPLSASGSRLANDNNGTLLVQNGVGVMGNIKVQDLTVLGTHNISVGAGATSIFPTGIVLGSETPSGVLVRSDLNGGLRITRYDSSDAGRTKLSLENGSTFNIAGTQASIIFNQNEFSFGPGGGNSALSISSGVISIGSPSYNTSVEDYISAYSLVPNRINGEEAFRGGLHFGSGLALRWTSDPHTISPTTNNFDLEISRSGVGIAAFSNPLISAPASILARNIGYRIESSGAISGALQIDMQGSRVQTFSVSTTGSFAAYNALGHMSFEKYLYVTAVGTVGLSFDNNWKWLGTKPVALGSGNTYLFTLTNFGAASSEILATYEVLGSGQ